MKFKIAFRFKMHNKSSVSIGIRDKCLKPAFNFNKKRQKLVVVLYVRLNTQNCRIVQKAVSCALFCRRGTWIGDK